MILEEITLGEDEESKRKAIQDNLGRYVILNDNPSFAYSSGTYCITGTNPTPVILGTIGGTFISTPVGLIINSSTGQIDLSTSALGTYTVTYTTNGTCPMSSFVQVTITITPYSTFRKSDTISTDNLLCVCIINNMLNVIR